MWRVCSGVGTTGANITAAIEQVLHRPLLVGGGLLALFLGIATATLIAWSPGEADTRPVSRQAEFGSRAGARCPECGVVASTRRVAYADASDPSARVIDTASGLRHTFPATIGSPHEVIVRMPDGSSRVFIEGGSSSWRPGERVIIIEGTGQTAD